MAATTKSILIIGATGLIGQHITRSILQNRHNFDKIGIFTSPNTLSTKAEEIETLRAQGVEIHSGDLTIPSDINEAYNGFDTVVSCVGSTGMATVALGEVLYADIRRACHIPSNTAD